MSRKSLMCLSGMIVVAIFVVIFTTAPSALAKNYNLKIGHLLPESLPCGAAANEFVKIVEEKTNGQIKAKTYFSQQLGPWQEQFDMVARGNLDMGFLAASPRYEELRPLSAPWVVTSWDQFRTLYNKGGVLYDYTTNAMDKLGIQLLHPFCIDFEGVGGMKGPIVYPEDVKKQGLKVRVMGGVSTLFWEDLGPAVKIDSAELFTALQLGTVDVMADMGALSIYGGFKEVTKYYTELNAFPGFGTFIINKKLWDSLTPDLQTVVMDAATKVCQECTDASEQMLGQITTMLEEGGTEVTRLTPEQRQKWIDEAKKPGGYFDKLRKDIGNETTDFLLKVSAEAAK